MTIPTGLISHPTPHKSPLSGPTHFPPKKPPSLTSITFPTTKTRPGLDTPCGFSTPNSLDNVSSVSSLIKEHVDDGLFEDAINVYVNLLESGFSVSEFGYFPCLIKAFGALGDVSKAELVHGHVIKLGFLRDLYVANAVLGMYWKCGAVGHALKVFRKMKGKDLVSLNSMVSGFARSGDFVGALEMFSSMIKEYGVHPNRVACLSALCSCASVESLAHGREVHGFIVRHCVECDEFLVSGLTDMYMKCGVVKSAERVFEGIFGNEFIRSNVVIWNVMITGYVYNECCSIALKLFVEMLELGIVVDSSTLVATLVLCSHLLDLETGKQVHGIVVHLGLESDVRVGTALMDMYFKCGDPETGLKILRSFHNRNLVMWGSAILNCAQIGYSYETLLLFNDFLMNYGVLDSVILLAALRGCSSLAIKSTGMEVHGLAVKLGLDVDPFVSGALVDFYGKCADMVSAHEIFNKLSTRDLICWNALISGYAQNGFADEALKAFCDMLSEKVCPNAVSIASMLSVCSLLPAITLCKEAHCYAIRHGFDANVLVNNSLINTYARCGDIKSSWMVFEKMQAKDETTWNSIILGFGMHGRTEEMFVMFDKMKEADVKPDHSTFTALLSGCSHAGNVELGWRYFNSMVHDYNLEPQLEQYTCMVDLLGRAGYLYQAYDLIRMMPCSPDEQVWGSLLASCKNHSKTKLAEVVANRIFELDPASIGYRVLLANLYEDHGKRKDVVQARSNIKHMGLKKQPGCSWIEVNNNLHVFIASDCSHSQAGELYATLESLTLEMKREGYVPHLHPHIVGADDSKGFSFPKEENAFCQQV